MPQSFREDFPDGSPAGSSRERKGGRIRDLIKSGEFKGFLPLILLAAAGLALVLIGSAVVSALKSEEAQPTSAEGANNFDSFDRTAEEERISVLLSSLSGISDAEVMIHGSEKVEGVAVICRGGGNAVNAEAVIGLIRSLYGIPCCRVSVGERW